MSQLTLPAPLIRRILERNPTVILHRRELKPGTFEVHNQHTIRTNTSRTRAGMVHLVEDSMVMVIEVSTVTEFGWDEISQKLVRLAGFKTTDEWKDSQKPGGVWACWFRAVEDARWLHQRVARGYTRNPALAMREGSGSPAQALDAADLERYAAEGWERRESLRAEDLDRQRRRSRAIRLKDAEKREDVEAIAGIRLELAELEDAIRARRDVA